MHQESNSQSVVQGPLEVPRTFLGIYEGKTIFIVIVRHYLSLLLYSVIQRPYDV